MRPTRWLVMLFAIAWISSACTPIGDEPETDAGDAGEKTTVTENPLRDVYFGDLHSHTRLSFDSYVAWNSNDQNDAYTFAKGGITLPLSEGHKDGNTSDSDEQPILSVPLDFAAITDHAEWFGELEACLDDSDTSAAYYKSDFCVRTREKDFEVFNELIDLAVGDDAQHHPICALPGADCAGRAHSVWEDIQGIADAHNQDGLFTTLIGYEYTGLVENQGMQHRNVFFRNSNVLTDPVTAIDYPHAEDLWARLEDQCNDQNDPGLDGPVPCEVLAIPHNPNYSWGQMLDPYADSRGEQHSRENLELRARMEPLIEIIQTKGSSECYNGLGSNDELCDFEQVFEPCPVVEPGPDGELIVPDHCVDERAFIRNAYKEGLAIADDPQYEVNPFKFGIIASMDTHNGIPGATEETTYKGHHGQSDVTAKKRLGIGVPDEFKELSDNPVNNPGGLAGVWATSHTRDGIFDALKRKETFGTSGTRIQVRFFGSFDFADNLDEQDGMIKTAYEDGVPMGGDLFLDLAGRPLKFLVWAQRDSRSAPLQKVQVIKGWVEGDQTYEKVYDVICADGAPPANGQCSSDASIDPVDCSRTGTPGSSELSTVWTDPDFDRFRRAFYYVRVLEDPTCRWSSRDALALTPEDLGDVELVLDDEQLMHDGGTPSDSSDDLILPSKIQERAWTSPIWYTPEPSGTPEG